MAGRQLALEAEAPVRVDRATRVVACAVALTAFAVLATFVSTHHRIGGDHRLRYTLRDDHLVGGGTVALRSIMSALTYLGGGTGLLLLASVALAVVVSQGNKRNVVFLVVAVEGASIVGRILKAAFDRPRPLNPVPHPSGGLRPVVFIAVLVVVLLVWRFTARRLLVLAVAFPAWLVVSELEKAVIGLRSGHDAFPSGHAVASMALTASVVLLSWGTRWRTTALVGGALFLVAVGGSRLYFGLHYPSDILAGWSLALAWVLAVDLLFDLRPLRGVGHRAEPIGTT